MNAPRRSYRILRVNKVLNEGVRDLISNNVSIKDKIGRTRTSEERQLKITLEWTLSKSRKPENQKIL